MHSALSNLIHLGGLPCRLRTMGSDSEMKEERRQQMQSSPDGATTELGLKTHGESGFWGLFPE